MTQLSDKDFYILWGEALESSDRDLYVSEWSSSIIWGEPEDLTDDDVIEIANYLVKLWDGAHMTIRDICTKAGLSQTAFAIRFCIKKRTVEDWWRGVRTPPDHDRLMMLRLFRLLPLQNWEP